MKYSIFPLRLGLGSVFLIFGFDKFINLGRNIGEVFNLGFISADLEFLKLFVLLLGILEILMALALFFGFLVRLTAFGASLFLIIILVSFWSKFGFFEYRDVGLLGMSISLFITGAGDISLDSFIKRRYNTDKV